MIHLLKLEWKKYHKNRLMLITALAYVIALPSLLFIGKTIDVSGFPGGFSNDIFFSFPTIWKFLGYIGNWLTFFILGYLGLYIITHEYSNKTLRQNILTGMSRNAFYGSKVQLIVFTCILATLYYFLCGLVIGYSHSEAGSYTTVFEYDYTLLRYFLMCMGYMTFGFLIGTVIRRSGLALILYFAWVLIIELMIRRLIHIKLVENKSMHFYPMNSVEDLMPIPFGEVADGFIQKYRFSFFLTFEEAIISSAIYILLFLILGFWYFRRADL